MENSSNIVLFSNKKQMPNLLSLCLDIIDIEILTLDKDLNVLIKSKRKDLHPQFYNDLISDIPSWDECLKEEKRMFESIKDTKSSRNVLAFDFEGEKISLLNLNISRYLSAHRDFYANFIYKVNTVKSILKKFRPETIFILPPETHWEKIIVVLGKKEGIRIIHLNKLRDKHDNFIAQNSCTTTTVTFLNSIVDIRIPYSFLPKVVEIMNYIKWLKNGLKSKKREEIDVLFFVFNKKYIKFVLPVIEEIDSEGFYKTLLLIPNSFDAKDLLENKNIRFETIESYINHEVVKDTNSVYSKILHNYRKEKKKEIFIGDLCSYNKLTFSFLSEEYTKTVYFSGSYILNLYLMERIIKIHTPKIFICPHYLEHVPRAFTIVCKRFGIPVVGIMSGFTTSNTENLEFRGDKLLVSGEQDKKSLCDRGMPEEKIVVTGLPIYDNLLSKKEDMEKIKNMIRDKLNIQEKKVVTYLTQTTGGNFDISRKKEEIEKVISAIKRLDDAYLIIKMHPTEHFDKNTYKEICARFGVDRYKVTRDEYDLDDLLIASDVAITKASTAGYNALIAGCDLICVDFLKSVSKNVFVESGVAVQAKSEEELFNLLKMSLESNEELVSTEKINNFLYQCLFKLDRNSAGRIKNEVYILIKEKQKRFKYT